MPSDVAKRDRGVEAAADQRVRVETRRHRRRRACAARSATGRCTNAWPSARARSAHQHDVAGLRAHVGHVRTIDPRMAVAQPLLAASRDHHARRHVAHISAIVARANRDWRRSRRLRAEGTSQTDARAALGHTVDDHGTHSEAPVDYPPICIGVGRAVAEGRAERGIVLGGSGQGEQIAANKVAGVRAALCHDLYTARLSREHNDANVLSMGGRIVRVRPRRRNPGAVARDAVRRRPPSAPPRSDSGGRNGGPERAAARVSRRAALSGPPRVYDDTNNSRDVANAGGGRPRDSRRRSRTSSTARTAGSS